MDQKFINNVFTRVASKYDFMNDIMSLGLHRLWKDKFVELVLERYKEVLADETKHQTHGDHHSISQHYLVQHQFENHKHSIEMPRNYSSVDQQNEILAKSHSEMSGADIAMQSQVASVLEKSYLHRNPHLTSLHQCDHQHKHMNQHQCHVQLLDVAAGSGDITKRFLKKMPGLLAVMLDINYEMLDRGRDLMIDQGLIQQYSMKSFGADHKQVRDTESVSLSGIRDQNLKFVVANAEHLPFGDGSYDLYTIAFGLRNVPNRTVALREAHRILSSGGVFGCLEFSHSQDDSPKRLNMMYKKARDMYMNLIPKMGQLFAGNRDSYQYLLDSITAFPFVEEVEQMLWDVGFEDVRSVQLQPKGVATVFLATKC